MGISNKELIQHFYTCFQNKDFKGMQQCYDDDAVFSDEVFKSLNASQVRSMWEMLIGRSHDLALTFSDIEADEIKGKAQWTAVYTFSKTNRRVVNHIQARFILNDGKIVQHVDSFDFYVWARQALGLPGLLLGWTEFMRKKVQKTAMLGLNKFMEKNT